MKESRFNKSGQKINYYRNRVGISKEQLARVINKPVSFMDDLENGNIDISNSVSFKTLFIMSEILNTSVYELLK